LISLSKRWHLLGAGSLGCLFAAYLQRAGIAVDLIVRDAATVQQLHTNGGITLSRDDQHATVSLEAATPNTIDGPIEQLIICTKAHQTPAALTAIKPKIADNAIIVLLQNGMGVRELLQRELPNAIILHALSTEGAFRSARFHVTHAGRGETVIGAIDPIEQSIAEAVVESLQCELPVKTVSDIQRRLWFKLAVNSVINPLTALHRCRNGELLSLQNIDATVMQLCEELAQVARAEYIDLSAAQMRDEVFRVMQATSANKSSMLQDVEAKRATEIDFINGFIARRAGIHGLPCAHHQHLLNAVRALHS
jgi:2-dehydropantoate 2-reductase